VAPAAWLGHGERIGQVLLTIAHPVACLVYHADRSCSNYVRLNYCVMRNAMLLDPLLYCMVMCLDTQTMRLQYKHFTPVYCKDLKDMIWTAIKICLALVIVPYLVILDTIQHITLT